MKIIIWVTLIAVVGLVTLSCDDESESDAPCEACCYCEYSCHFVNAFGSGTASSKSTITSSSPDVCWDCEEECMSAAEGPGSDCVSNINMSVAEACEDE